MTHPEYIYTQYIPGICTRVETAPYTFLFHPSCHFIFGIHSPNHRRRLRAYQCDVRVHDLRRFCSLDQQLLVVSDEVPHPVHRFLLKVELIGNQKRGQGDRRPLRDEGVAVLLSPGRDVGRYPCCLLYESALRFVLF